MRRVLRGKKCAKFLLLKNNRKHWIQREVHVIKNKQTRDEKSFNYSIIEIYYRFIYITYLYIFLSWTLTIQRHNYIKHTCVQK